jgi:hypothetical protein
LFYFPDDLSKIKFQINLSDNLPQRICNSCLEKFSVATTIKNLFQKSDDSLHNRQKKDPLIKTEPEILIEIERRPHRSTVKPVNLDFIKKIKRSNNGPLPDPVCQYCEIELQTKPDLFEHLDRHHREPADEKFHCPAKNCAFEANASNVIVYHLWSHQ